MNITRRYYGKSALALMGAFAMARCAPGTTPGAPTIPAQILADVQGLVPVIQETISVILAENPAAIPAATQAKLTALETAAASALNTLSTISPANLATATQLQAIDAYLNTAIAAVNAALPAIVTAFPSLAPYVPLAAAAGVLITTVLEPYINSIITQAQTTSLTAVPATAPAPTPAATTARATLSIPQQ